MPERSCSIYGVTMYKVARFFNSDQPSVPAARSPLSTGYTVCSFYSHLFKLDDVVMVECLEKFNLAESGNRKLLDLELSVYHIQH